MSHLRAYQIGLLAGAAFGSSTDETRKVVEVTHRRNYTDAFKPLRIYHGPKLTKAEKKAAKRARKHLDNV